MFWVYMLRCSDRSFYVGHTDNLEVRIAQHEQGAITTCYTYLRRPVALVYSAPFVSREEALAMERRIKGWNRAKKDALTRGDWAEISRISRFKYGRKHQNPSTGSG
jgi:predicted GIY-YIG superfamily endonuclease